MSEETTALGLLDGLGEIADIGRDKVGQTLASAERTCPAGFISFEELAA